MPDWQYEVKQLLLKNGNTVDPKSSIHIRDNVHGVLIHAYDPNDPEQQRHFWTFQLDHEGKFANWAEVDRLARIAANGYGITLAAI